MSYVNDDDLVQPVNDKSWSYRVIETEHGTPEDAVWTEWFRAHRLPPAQVPLKTWVARDVRRNTVSVLVFDWDLDEEPDGERSIAYVDRNDDGEISEARAPRFAVLTIQLESKPLPFPDFEAVGNDCA